MKINTAFLHEPATKRDVLTSSAAISLLVVLVVFAVVVMAIKLYNDLEDNRSLTVRLEHAHDELVKQTSALREVDEVIQSEQAQAARTIVRHRRTIREVRTIVEQAIVPPPPPTPAPTPFIPGIDLSGRERVRPVLAELPARPVRPVRTPVPRPERPRLVPVLPDLPRLPERPQTPAPAPAPTPAPTPPPPPVAPPIVERPHPGNKPPHAPCPPKNPHC